MSSTNNIVKECNKLVYNRDVETLNRVMKKVKNDCKWYKTWTNDGSIKCTLSMVEFLDNYDVFYDKHKKCKDS